MGNRVLIVEDDAAIVQTLHLPDLCVAIHTLCLPHL